MRKFKLAVYPIAIAAVQAFGTASAYGFFKTK